MPIPSNANISAGIQSLLGGAVFGFGGVTRRRVVLDCGTARG